MTKGWHRPKNLLAYGGTTILLVIFLIAGLRATIGSVTMTQTIWFWFMLLVGFGVILTSEILYHKEKLSKEARYLLGSAGSLIIAVTLWQIVTPYVNSSNWERWLYIVAGILVMVAIFKGLWNILKSGSGEFTSAVAKVAIGGVIVMTVVVGFFGKDIITRFWVMFNQGNQDAANTLLNTIEQSQAQQPFNFVSVALLFLLFFLMYLLARKATGVGTYYTNVGGRITLFRLMLVLGAIFLLWTNWDPVFERIIRTVPLSVQSYVREIFDTNTENFWKILVIGGAALMVLAIPQPKIGRVSGQTQDLILLAIVLGLAFGYGMISEKIIAFDAEHFNVHGMVEQRYPGAGFLLPWVLILLVLMVTNSFLNFGFAKAVVFSLVLIILLNIVSWWMKPTVRVVERSAPTYSQPVAPTVRTPAQTARVQQQPAQALPGNDVIGPLPTLLLGPGNTSPEYRTKLGTCFQASFFKENGDVPPREEWVHIYIFKNGSWSRVQGLTWTSAEMVRYYNPNNYNIISAPYRKLGSC